MVYGYARVSTKAQAKDGNSLDVQRKELQASGAEVIFEDVFTGTKLDRPEFEKLRKKIIPGDMIIVTKLDRLSRSVSQASGLITELIDAGVSVNVLNLGVLSGDSVNTLKTNYHYAVEKIKKYITDHQL